jgi:hypothetical protein
MATNFPKIPYIKTWVSGQVMTAGDMNTQIRDTVDFFTARKPHASAYGLTSSITYPDNSWTDTTLDAISVDTHGGFDSSGVYTAAISGWYQVMGCVLFVPDAAFDRGIRFVLDGQPVSGVSIVDSPNAGYSGGVCLSRMVPIVAGQNIRLQGWHNAGHNVNSETSCAGYLDLAFFSQFYSYTA